MSETVRFPVVPKGDNFGVAVSEIENAICVSLEPYYSEDSIFSLSPDTEFHYSDPQHLNMFGARFVTRLVLEPVFGQQELVVSRSE